MKLLLLAFLVVSLTSHVYPSGPTYPKKYRNPTKEELSSEWRKEDPNEYVTVASDFNGDGLVDSAFLLVDDKKKELILLVALYNENSSYTWIELQTMNYAALNYQGIALVEPTTVSVYKSDITEETKQSMTLKFNSIKSFSSEGSSSIFAWDSSKKQFQQHWLTK
jgi:hypothetical protein